MVKIFSPYRGPDPLGATLSNLGKQMFGDQTANALNNEKLYAAQRENAETDNIMGRIANGGGAQAITADPIAQAMLLGSGYDPSKFGNIALLGGATQFGARDPRTQNLQVGTGQSFDNTAGAFDAKLAETARNNNLASSDRRYGVDQSQATERDKFFYEPKPVVNPDGTTGFARQGELAGSTFQPVLSDTEQKARFADQNFGNMGALPEAERQYIGANVSSGSRAPKNYIVTGPNGPQTFLTDDGRTDLQTGQVLPPGGYIGTVQGDAKGVGLTNSVRSELEGSQIAYDKFMSVANMADNLTADPTLFGPQGFLRNKAQDVLQTIGGAKAILGAKADLATNLVSSETGQLLGEGAARALIPEFYDPRLNEVESLWGILLYQGASALAGQENRSVSDKDIEQMRSILGDPQSLFSSNLSMKAKLDMARRLVAEGRKINEQYLNGTPAPSDATAAPATAPAAQPDGSTIIDGVKIRRIN